MIVSTGCIWKSEAFPTRAFPNELSELSFNLPICEQIPLYVFYPICNPAFFRVFAVVSPFFLPLSVFLSESYTFICFTIRTIPSGRSRFDQLAVIFGFPFFFISPYFFAFGNVEVSARNWKIIKNIKREGRIFPDNVLARLVRNSTDNFACHIHTILPVFFRETEFIRRNSAEIRHVVFQIYLDFVITYLARFELKCTLTESKEHF